MKKASPADRRSYDVLKVIKQLLKALQVAHADKNTILFERIKTVLALIARGNTSSQEESKGTSAPVKLSKEEMSAQNKDRKILMTEVVGLVLKPTKDAKMHQAYIDCFVALTK